MERGAVIPFASYPKHCTKPNSENLLENKMKHACNSLFFFILLMLSFLATDGGAYNNAFAYNDECSLAAVRSQQRRLSVCTLVAKFTISNEKKKENVHTQIGTAHGTATLTKQNEWSVAIVCQLLIWIIFRTNLTFYSLAEK